MHWAPLPWKADQGGGRGFVLGHGKPPRDMGAVHKAFSLLYINLNTIHDIRTSIDAARDHTQFFLL